MGCLNGGRGTNGAKGTYAPSSDENPTFTARIKGGHIHGAVFGGAADSDSPGSRRIIVTGGTIEVLRVEPTQPAQMATPIFMWVVMHL